MLSVSNQCWYVNETFISLGINQYINITFRVFSINITSIDGTYLKYY